LCGICEPPSGGSLLCGWHTCSHAAKPHQRDPGSSLERSVLAQSRNVPPAPVRNFPLWLRETTPDKQHRTTPKQHRTPTLQKNPSQDRAIVRGTWQNGTGKLSAIGAISEAISDTHFCGAISDGAISDTHSCGAISDTHSCGGKLGVLRSFNNAESRLPAGGKYREFDVDVKPPSGTSRNAERLVVDEGTGRAWYTDDHYGSFTEIK